MSEIIAELKNVYFSYGEKVILEDVSLTVCRGEKIGIVGESGCGKSTLLCLLAGLYEPSSGIVRIEGETEAEKISAAVSVVMQTPMLLPMTIYENITLGNEYSDKWIRHILELSSLDKWIDSLENGVHTYLGDRANELSGGQAQRIAIARAMCKDADLILLDEPTSALDSETRESVLEALKNATEGKTVIHVTHDNSQLKDYDCIYRLQGAKLKRI